MDVEDDIGADVRAAMEGATNDGAAAAPPPAVDTTDAPSGDAKPGQHRGPDGKFAKADPATGEVETAAPGAQQPTDQPAAVGAEAQAEPIRPPAAWSAAAKSMFATLDPVLQAEIAKRERDMDKGLADRASQLKRYEPLDQVIAPHRNRLAMAGVDDVSYVRSLVAADEALRGPNPLQALHQIAQMYGIDLRQPVQPGQQPPQAAQLPPEFRSLAQQVASLQTELAQQRTAAQQQESSRVQSEIDAFAKDHLYFENVKPEMIALLRGGVVDDLESAYRRACWARDDIRPLLLKEEETKRASEAAAAARAKANEARQAGGSITGSPAPGATTPPPANANASIEDDVRAAYAATVGRA